MLCLPEVQEFLIVCLRASSSRLDLVHGRRRAAKKGRDGEWPSMQPVLAVRCGDGNVPISHCRTDCAPTSGSGLAFDVLGRRLDPVSRPG